MQKKDKATGVCLGVPRLPECLLLFNPIIPLNLGGETVGGTGAQDPAVVPRSPLRELRKRASLSASRASTVHGRRNPALQSLAAWGCFHSVTSKGVGGGPQCFCAGCILKTQCPGCGGVNGAAFRRAVRQQALRAQGWMCLLWTQKCPL